ncbi:MAG: hypothetical protein AAGG53_07090 [Cyanobacteria bacterium P01_H01_bin.152]
MKCCLFGLFAATLPIAPALAGETLPHEVSYHPDQLQPPASLEHLYVYRPACRQLESRRSDTNGWTAWGMKDSRGKFMQWYGLPTTPESEAYYWLEAAGLCVEKGAIAEMISPAEHQALLNGAGDAPDAPGYASPTSAAAKAEHIRESNTDGESISLDRALFLLGCIGFVAMGFKPEKETPARDLQAPSAPVMPAPPVVPSMPQVTIADAEIDTAVGEMLTAPLYTRIFLGGQRSGKSFAASRLSRYLRQQNGTQVYAINLALVKNPEYWEHANAAAIADLTSPTITEQSALAAIKQAQSVLNEFKRHKNALLLIDEWTIIGATTFRFNEHLKPFIDDVCSTITTLSSRGLQADQAIWLIAPHCRLDFLEKSAKALKLCKLCLVAANPAKPFDVDGNRISFDGELFDQVKNNWRDVTAPPKGVGALDSERIAFINGQWLPLGSIEVTVTTAEPASVTAVTNYHGGDTALFYTRLSEVCNLTVTEVTGALSALQQGMSKTHIIKNIWGYTGRNYGDYSQRFDQLQQLTEVNQDV